MNYLQKYVEAKYVRPSDHISELDVFVLWHLSLPHLLRNRGLPYIERV